VFRQDQAGGRRPLARMRDHHAQLPLMLEQRLIRKSPTALPLAASSRLPRLRGPGVVGRLVDQRRNSRVRHPAKVSRRMVPSGKRKPGKGKGRQYTFRRDGKYTRGLCSRMKPEAAARAMKLIITQNAVKIGGTAAPWVYEIKNQGPRIRGQRQLAATHARREGNADVQLLPHHRQVET
jgi:hypothetical protein